MTIIKRLTFNESRWIYREDLFYYYTRVFFVCLFFFKIDKKWIWNKISSTTKKNQRISRNIDEIEIKTWLINFGSDLRFWCLTTTDVKFVFNSVYARESVLFSAEVFKWKGGQNRRIYKKYICSIKY